jgi:5'(3')-deoxyribonucleotidase
MKRILVDMDEVIADTTTGMTDWYRKIYGGNIDYNKMLAGKSLVKGFPDEHQAAVRQQLYEPGFFRHLPVMKDSIEVLEQMNQRYDIYIVSAATEFPNSLKDKLDWLGEYFPFITWQQLVLCGDKKMIQADVMIDDHARHLELFKGEPYLFSAGHNLEETRFARLTSWENAATIFL